MSTHATRRSPSFRHIVAAGSLFVAAMVLMGAGATSPTHPAAAGPDTTVSIDLAFKTHLDMDMPEQDVYIERVPGSGKVGIS